MKPPRLLSATDLGLCPCGKKIYANAKSGAVIHETPFCKNFEDLDPLEFIIFVRKYREKEKL